MAEDLGVPTKFADKVKTWQYPWAAWMREPFVQWVATPGVDFPMKESRRQTLRDFNALIHTRAKRKGVNVVTLQDDPEFSGRVTFSFYRGDQPPELMWSASSFTSEDGSDPQDAAQRVTCELCGDVQARAEHLTDIRECLIKNPNDPADFNLYARHRPDDETPTGLRKVAPFGEISWTKEEGPL